MKFKRMFLVLIVVFMLLSVPCSYASINDSNLNVGKQISIYDANGSDFPVNPLVPFEPTQNVRVNVALDFIKLSQMNWKEVYWNEDDQDRASLCYGILVNIDGAIKAYEGYNLDLSIRMLKMANNLVNMSYKL